MALALEELAPGFDDPVIGTQACFRGVLQAMSHPGRVVELPATQQPRPPALAAASAALLLTLLDAETTVSLVGSLNTVPVWTWLRFHTGTRAPRTGEEARFTVVRAGELEASLWRALPLGSDDAPQDGATLIVEVPLWTDTAATAGPVHRLQLQGPGVVGQRALDVVAVPSAFWAHRIALQTQFPRGFDLLLVRGRELFALPRSTRITVER